MPFHTTDEGTPTSGPRREMWVNIEHLTGTRPYTNVLSVAQFDLDSANVHRANEGTAAAIGVVESFFRRWASTEKSAGRAVAPGHYRVTLNDQYNADVIAIMVVRLDHDQED